MMKVTFYNKRLLCYIDDTDFTDYQGIGADPMYLRYDSVYSIVQNHIAEEYRDFLARPFYEDGLIYWYVAEWIETPVQLSELNGSKKEHYKQIKEETLKQYNKALSQLNAEEHNILSSALKYVNDDFIYCYDNKVVLIAWGMRPDTNKHKVSGQWVKGLKNEEKCTITFDCGTQGKIKGHFGKNIHREKGARLTAKDIPEIIPNDGYIFTRWSTDPIGYEVTGNITFIAQYEKAEKSETQKQPDEQIVIRFECGEYGHIEGNEIISINKGEVLKQDMVPNIQPNEGYRFIGWQPTLVFSPLYSDMTYVARLERETVQCRFIPGEQGDIEGKSILTKPKGTTLSQSEIPTIKPKKGYKFMGWSQSTNCILNHDYVFNAQYERILPWYKRLWLWFTGKGCLKWLLWLILGLLAILLLLFLLRGCKSCSSEYHKDIYGNEVLDNDTVIPVETVRDADGVVRDKNGKIRNIYEDGHLPNENVVSPIVGDDGIEPPIVDNQGAPDVIANRLNIYFDTDNPDLDKWAQDFKEQYPGDQYQIIGCDRNVPMIQIMIPESERDKIRNELPERIKSSSFFVVDESIIQLQGNVSSVQNDELRGWHLKAIHAQESWSISKGSSDVVIAIVDDGIDTEHPMFSGKFYNGYNVFTQNRELSCGQGHGTHVAGLAAGNLQFLSDGVAGIAPDCKIMPVQVFDNGMCTFSSLASGIMYAIHNGANVVNVSIGPSFNGLDQLPLEEQQKIAKSYFKNEERVFRHIIKVANDKNTVIVFAAGNDNVMTAILPNCRETNNTINVSAVTPELKAADFTNYSIGSNVSAPGVSIYSSFPKKTFAMLDGTSMAAPIVSGAVALALSIKPDIKVEQIIGTMQQTGKKSDRYVPPILILDKFLEAVKNGNIASGVLSDNVDNESQYSDKTSQRTEDGYSAIKQMIEQLKAQRDAIDKKINELEQKIK